MENLMDIYVGKKSKKKQAISGRIILDDNNFFSGIIGEEGDFQLVFGEIISKEKLIVQLLKQDNIISSTRFKCKKNGRSIYGKNANSKIRIYPADLTREVTPREIAYVKRMTNTVERRLKKTYVK